MYHTWDEVKDPARCPYCEESIRCIRLMSAHGNPYPVPEKERNCESCAWGPHKLAIKRRRLAAIRAKMQGGAGK